MYTEFATSVFPYCPRYCHWPHPWEESGSFTFTSQYPPKPALLQDEKSHLTWMQDAATPPSSNGPLWTCSSMFMSVILVSQGLHPPLQMWPHLCWVETKSHLLLPADRAFRKADHFGKILAFSFTVVVKTTVTGFRKTIQVMRIQELFNLLCI